MAKKIIVTSGKGGVGKTTVSAMLAVELALMGKKTLVFDYDTGLRNQDIILGMQNEVVYNVIDFIEGNANIDQILIQHRNYPNLYLLSTSQYAKQNDIDSNDLKKVIDAVDSKFDFIIIDSPAGIEKYVKNAIKKVDTRIVISTCDDVCIRDAEKVIFEINKRELGRPYLLVNKVNPKLVLRGSCYSPQKVAEILDTELLGYVQDDIKIKEAINSTGLPDRSSISFMAINRIARRLLGEKVEIPKIKKRFLFF